MFKNITAELSLQSHHIVFLNLNFILIYLLETGSGYVSLAAMECAM